LQLGRLTNLKNKYAYDDFGNLATNSTETITNHFKYVGKFGVQTDLPDLLYMRARYYLPSIGRFNQYDPIGAINPYSYVGNNPMNWIDPSGNQAVLEEAMIPLAIISIAITVLQFSQSKHTKEVIEGLIRTMEEHAGKICGGDPNDPNKDHWKKEIKAAKERIQRLLKRLKGTTKEYYEKVIETIENRIR
jgi:RHS repeat-associated protein